MAFNYTCSNSSSSCGYIGSVDERICITCADEPYEVCWNNCSYYKYLHFSMCPLYHCEPISPSFSWFQIIGILSSIVSLLYVAIEMWLKRALILSYVWTAVAVITDAIREIGRNLVEENAAAEEENEERAPLISPSAPSILPYSMD